MESNLHFITLDYMAHFPSTELSRVVYLHTTYTAHNTTLNVHRWWVLKVFQGSYVGSTLEYAMEP